MDFTNSFPGSWSLVRKNLPGLIGAGVGAAAASIAAGRRAYNQVQRDNQTKFSTWSTKSSKMPYKAVRRMNRRKPSYRRRPYNRYQKKGMSGSSTKRFVRSTGYVTNVTITAGTSAFGSNNVLLSSVYTPDIITMYRLYRIRKVVAYLCPRVDAGNSGLANNFQPLVAMACDPESTAVPTGLTSITCYDNSYQKFLKSTEQFTYTFYPKVTNSVDISGTATAAGSYGSNPWLRLDATGITVPHLSLKYGIITPALTTVSYDIAYDIHFDVRGIV